MDFKKEQGYIALITMIIIGAIILSLALAMTFLSLGQQKSMINQQDALQARYLSNACAHYAILQIQDDRDYRGNETVEIDAQSCQIEYITGSDQQRTIITSSTVGNNTKKIRVEISQITPKTETSFWGDFIE